MPSSKPRPYHLTFAVLHIPHSSRMLPPDVRPSLLLSDQALSDELRRMTDAYTDELFSIDPTLALPVVFPVSRLVVDPERFLDDAAEPMAARGMGAVYMRTAYGEPLRAPLDAATRGALIARYFEPHHRRLTDAVDRALACWGACLIVDCHSFPSRPLPYELDQAGDRPDICLGTDTFHTPGDLAAAAERLFCDAGFQVMRDRPFAGALVPGAHYRRDARVLAIMVEINRALYLDEASGERAPCFNDVAGRLRTVIEALIVEARGTSSRSGTDDTPGRTPK